MHCPRNQSLIKEDLESGKILSAGEYFRKGCAIGSRIVVETAVWEGVRLTGIAGIPFLGYLAGKLGSMTEQYIEKGTIDYAAADAEAINGAIVGVLAFGGGVAAGKTLSVLAKTKVGRYLKLDALEKLIQGALSKEKPSAQPEMIGDNVNPKLSNRVLSIEDAEEYAFNAIKGSHKADCVVLGKSKKIHRLVMVLLRKI